MSDESPLLLADIEDLIIQSYRNWKKNDNKQTKHDLFVSIKQLASAVIIAKYGKANIDFEKAAYEYSVYLFQRILKGRLNLENCIDRFPLQQYMSLNVRHIIHSMREELEWVNVINECEDELEEEMKLEPDDIDVCEEVSNKGLAKNLISGLNIFYTKEEINRYYPMVRELIYCNQNNIIPPYIPEDVREFMMVLVSISKRLYNDNRYVFETNMKKEASKDITKRLQSAMRSTIFLSAVSNSEILPKELLLALDIDSLYRLVSIAGGRTLKIPKEKELESLMGASVAACNMILDNQKFDKALNNAKKDYGFIFDKRINIQDLSMKLVASADLDKEMSEPVINIIEKLILFFDAMISDVSNMENISNADLLRLFSNISNSISNLTKNIYSIKDRIEETVENVAQIDNKEVITFG